MSENTRKELFDYLVQEYAKLEAEWWSAQSRKDSGAQSLANAEQKKLVAVAATLGFDCKQLEMLGFGYSLDILIA